MGQQATTILMVPSSTDLLGLQPPPPVGGRLLLLGYSQESRVRGKPGPSTFWASMSPTPTYASNLWTFYTSAPQGREEGIEGAGSSIRGDFWGSWLQGWGFPPPQGWKGNRLTLPGPDFSRTQISRGSFQREMVYLLSNEQNGAEPSATPLRTPQPPVVAGHPWALQARHLSPSIR